MEKRSSRLFPHPFSREYWRAALAEMRNPRMLVFAALVLALRVALKPVKIPIVADLSEGVGFIVNAIGSMVYGPVLALLSGALSDALGFMLFPDGPYFPLFMLTEMAGSFVFALFLYRAEITVPRLLLSRFSVCLLVNVVLAWPIWVLYYQMMLSKPYAIAMIRVVKNLAMFPVETVILAVVLRAVVPALRQQRMVWSGTDGLSFTKRHVILLAALTLLGIGTVGGYAVYSYNTRSYSADYTPAERLEKNLQMREIAAEELGLPEEELAVIIESAHSRFLVREMTYEVAVYRIDGEAFEEKRKAAEADPSAEPYTLDTVNGYSKTPASKDSALIRIGDGVIVTDKSTGEKLSAEFTPRE